jgi:hypothetical protein
MIIFSLTINEWSNKLQMLAKFSLNFFFAAAAIHNKP